MIGTSELRTGRRTTLAPGNGRGSKQSLKKQSMESFKEITSIHDVKKLYKKEKHVK